MKVSGSVSVSYSNHASDVLRADLWVVNKGFKFDIDENTYIYIPEGYLTDGASVPRWLWVLIPPWGNHGKASVVHDYLCEYLQVWKNGERVKISRSECDQILYKCLVTTGVGKVKAKAMYAAVVAYSHLASVIYYSYDPQKHEMEKFLVSEYKRSGLWL